MKRKFSSLTCGVAANEPIQEQWIKKKKIVDMWSAVALRIWVLVNPEWADHALHID